MPAEGVAWEWTWPRAALSPKTEAGCVRAGVEGVSGVSPLSGVRLECRRLGKLWPFHNRGFESFKWLVVRCYTDSFNLPK